MRDIAHADGSGPIQSMFGEMECMFQGLRVKVMRENFGRYLHVSVPMGAGEYTLHYCIEKTDTAYGLYGVVFFKDVSLKNIPIIGFRNLVEKIAGGISDGLSPLLSRNMVMWELWTPVTTASVAEKTRQMYRIVEQRLPGIDALLFLQRKLACT